MSIESRARDDHCGQKRKHGHISPDGSRFIFDNKLKLFYSPSDGSDEARHSPETENGHASKKSRVTPSSPAVCTPIIPKEKHSYPSETSSPLTTTPGESTSTLRKSRGHSSPTPSSDDNHSSDSRKEGEDHDETHQEHLSPRKLSFVDETSEEIIGFLQRDQAQQKLIERLKQLAEVGPKYEIDLEMADLLKMLSSSNPQLQNVAKKASEASMQLQNGVKLMRAVARAVASCFH